MVLSSTPPARGKDARGKRSVCQLIKELVSATRFWFLSPWDLVWESTPAQGRRDPLH